MFDSNAAWIKVDVDQVRPWTVAKLVGRLARANRRLVALGQSRSPSGNGWHLWIEVDPVPETNVEVVALQLLLGSDPHREAYNLNRARRVDAGEIRKPFDKSWNVFYRKAAV